MDLVKLRAVDETGVLDITYFNQNYVKDQLLPGVTYIFYGKIGGTFTRKTMTNPLFEREDSSGGVTGRIVPVYRLTAGLTQKTLINSVRQGLDACGEDLPDALPAGIAEKNKLAQPRFAYENVHFPPISGFGALQAGLVFEELFVLASARPGAGGVQKRTA
jgi:ATP-dependent DNA helicase RecG